MKIQNHFIQKERENLLSKKNTQEYMRKTERNHFKFTIRKLSVGVVSLLLGFIFGTGMYANQGLVVHADATSANTATKTASTTSDSRSTSAATTSAASNATSAQTSEASEASAGSSTATSTAASATSSATQTSTANATSAQTSKESEASTSSSVATNKVKVLVTRIVATTNNSASASTTQQAISTTITTRPVNVSEDTAVTSTGNVLQDIYSTDGKYTTTVTATNNTDSTQRVYMITLLPSYNQLYNTSKDTKAKVGLDNEATPAKYLTMNGLTNEKVTFSAKAGEYLTYDKYVAKYSWDDLLAIYYQGDLAAGATAKASFQTKVINLSDLQAQMTAAESEGQVARVFGNGVLTYSIQGYYGTSVASFDTPQSIVYLSKKLSSLTQEIGTIPYAEVTITDGNTLVYNPAPESIQKAIPEVTDSDLTVLYPDGTKADALWYGGKYTIDTISIQNAIKDMGYSVNVNPDGRSTWPVYKYTGFSYGNVIINLPDNDDGDAVQKLYVEVQKVFDTKNITITTKDDWVPATDLVSATLKLKNEPSDSYTNTENLEETGNYTYTVTNNATGKEVLSGKGTDSATNLTAGVYTVKYLYTFSDGSAVTKTATLTVLTYTPKGQDQTVEENSQPSAANSISNRGDLPDGTTYTWDKTPDTSTPGDKSAVVIVTYPDGTTDKVPVTIHVTSQADGITNKRGLPEGPNYTLKANPDVFEPCATTGTKTMQSNLVDPSVSVEETANVTKAPKKTAATKLPQTGDMDKNGGTLFGLALAGVTGLFGGLSLRKKKEDD